LSSPVLSLGCASAAPRPDNSDSHGKDALFGLDTQITILTEKKNKGKTKE
jgi:hypothetical protein